VLTLVNSNLSKPPIAPLGLEYLAEAARDQGLEAEIVDLCFETDPAAALARRLADADPELVAITFRNSDNCMLLSSHSFLPELADLVAAARTATAAPIVVGGAGFSVAPAAIMQALGVEYGVLGDGEQAVPLLLRALRGELHLQEVPGLLWREAEAIRSNPPEWPEIFSQPALRRDKIDNRRYLERGGQLGLETKRGCDRNCIYCADPLSKGRRRRLRSPAAIADEVENLLRRGLDVYHLCDSEFNLPHEHAVAVCDELVRRGLGDQISWYAYLTPHPFSAELADLMQRAGCAGINFGADSGNDRMLARLGRDFSSAETLQTVRLCHQHGLAVMLDLLIGAPGETRETARQSIEFVKAADPSCAGISLGVRIYAGTRLAHTITAQRPMSENPAICGQATDNPEMLAPVFYLSADLGDPQEAASFLSEVIAGDARFFFGGSGDERDYDYDDNQALVDAIAAGARGAYWDILRRHRTGAL